MMFISKCLGGKFSPFCGTTDDTLFGTFGDIYPGFHSHLPVKDDMFVIVSVLCCRALFRKSQIFSLSTRNTICPVILPSAPRLDCRQSMGAILR